MLRDCLGNPVTAADADLLAVIDDFVAGFLAYQTRAERVVAAAAQPRLRTDAQP